MKYIYLLLIIFVTSSCHDFLEEKSQDLRIPKSVKEYKELIFGECLDHDKNLCSYLDVMTDDVTELFDEDSWASGDNRINHWAYYTWQRDPEQGLNNTFRPDDSWKEFYSRILLCNVLVDKISEMEGSDDEKKDIEAEACFVKAYSYFMLANLYGRPYSESTAKTDLCVPINYETGIVDKVYKRNSVDEVYAEMELNIKQAISLFKESNIQKTIFRPNLNAAYLLASRIFLFQKKYKEAIDYATLVIEEKGETLADITEKIDKYFFTKHNPEILMSFGYFYNGGYEPNVNAFFGMSSSLKGLYPKNDLRIEAFFNDALVVDKWFSETDAYSVNFRLSEAYLNRAEAYAEMEKFKLAMDDVNKIRENRLFIGTRKEENDKGELVPVTYVFTEETATDIDEAREKVRKQRRLELCFEGFRWFDLRRWGMPEITHVYSDREGNNSVTYILKEKSEAYTLPAPKSVLDRNSYLNDIKRPERDNSTNETSDN